MEFTLNLQKDRLRDDVENIRCQREHMDNSCHTIVLTWTNAEGINKQMPIQVMGSNLWVKGYCYPQNTGFRRFYVREADESYKKSDSNVKIPIDLNVMIAELNKLALALERGGEIDFLNTYRKQFLMIIFLTSEMVRNELLELCLLHGDINSENYVKWTDCKILMSNWSTVSRCIYPVSGKDFIPTIRFRDVCNYTDDGRCTKEIREFKKLCDGFLSCF
ncbi:MAG: hypothetical protein K2M46_11235 [Lachnospiraceae bacterium]|nr:hypothetical protein [Lachnospiraceae bacterium]